MSAGQVLADLGLAPRCPRCGDPRAARNPPRARERTAGRARRRRAGRERAPRVPRGGGSAPRPARGARRGRRDEGRDAARRGERGAGRGRSPRTRLRDRSGRVTRGRWLVRGLLLFVLAFTNLNDIWSPDVLPNALFAWTVIRERNVDYDEFTVGGAPPPRPPARGGFLDREAYFFRACGVSTATAPPKAVRSPGGPPAPGPRDHVCSVFPPGMAVLALPFFAPFVLAGVFPDDLGLLIRVGHVAAAFFEVLATLLLWSVLRRFTSARWSLVLVLLYFLATSVRTVSSQALWQHPGVHLAVASALWLTLHEDLVPLRRELLAGAA